MLKLSIYNSPNHTDLHLFTYNPESEEIKLLQILELPNKKMKKITDEIIGQHMKPADRVVNYYFNQDDSLQSIKKQTVLDYQKESLKLN